MVYELHVDTQGDAKPHLSYRFTFHTERSKDDTFLYNTGPIETLDDEDLNLRQTYTVTEIVDGESTVLADGLPVPPAHIGPKSTPDYASLFAGGVKTIKTESRCPSTACSRVPATTPWSAYGPPAAGRPYAC